MWWPLLEARWWPPMESTMSVILVSIAFCLGCMVGYAIWYMWSAGGR